MSEIIVLGSFFTAYCLFLFLSDAVMWWWKRRQQTVGCNCDDECRDCRDVKNERV